MSGSLQQRGGTHPRVGKTNVPEFTLEGYTGNPIHGVMGNPWVLFLPLAGRAAVTAGLVPSSAAAARLGHHTRHHGFYLALGTFTEGFAMIVTTIPVVTALGYGPICRGVIVTMLIEIDMVRPPDGTIMYVLKGMRRTTEPIIDVFAVMQSVSTCLRS